MLPGGVKRGKPRTSGPPKPKVRIAPPRPEVSVGPPPKPQKTVQHGKRSFPAPRPEVTRPVTRKQTRAIQRGVGEAAAKSGHIAVDPYRFHGKKVKVTGGDPLSGLNHIFTVAGNAADAGLKKIGAPKIIRNASRDTLDTPAQVIPTTVFALTHPAAALKGTEHQIKFTVEHPGKAFTEHPVNTALIVRGGVASVGRGAGAVARAGVLGKSVKGAASLERPDLKLVGNVSDQRRYSKDVTEKAVQVVKDKHARKQQGILDKAEPIQASARQLRTNGKLTRGALGRRLDQEVGRNEGIRRHLRNIAILDRHHGMPKHGADATPLVAEGVIKSHGTVHRDLEAELGRLKQEHDKGLEPHHAKANEHNQKIVSGLMDNKKFLEDPAPAFRAARAYAAEHGRLESERIKFGDLERGQAERRKLLPFAVRELGLKFDEETKRFLRERSPQDETRLAKVRDVYAAAKKAAEGTAARKRQAEARYHLERQRTHSPTPNTIQDLANAVHWDERAQGELAQADEALRAEQRVHEVPNHEIRRAFVQAGGKLEHLSYVPHVPNFKQPGNFYAPTFRRPTPETKRFTGETARSGAYQRDYEVLIHQHVKAAGKVAQHKGVDSLVNSFGHVDTNGQYFTTLNDANREIRNQEAATGLQWSAFKVVRGQKDPKAIKEGLAPAELPQMFREAERGDSGGIVLFPKQVADALKAHEAVNAGSRVEIARGYLSAQQRFRHVVLPTSSKWLVGNVAEMLFRTGINDPTFVRTMHAGWRLEQKVRQMGGEEAVQRLRAFAGQGHFGAQQRYDIHREAEAATTKFAHEFAHAKAKGVGPDNVRQLWEGYKAGVQRINTAFESGAYYHAIGKEAQNEVHALTGSWLKALNHAGKAHEDVARGIVTDSNALARYGRAVDEVRGRYTNLSPNGRFVVMWFTPFGPWYVNALHFVTKTLPLRHPIKTGVYAAANASQKPQLEAAGETHFPQKGKGAKPEYLLGGAATRYVPFGAWRDPGAAAADLVAPVISSPGENLVGLDFKHKQARNAQGAPVDIAQRAAMAINTTLESFTPFLRHARQVREQGGSSVDTSTALSPQIKHGTKQGVKVGLRRAFDPTYVGGNKKTATSAIDDLNSKYGTNSTSGVDDLLSKYGLK